MGVMHHEIDARSQSPCLELRNFGVAPFGHATLLGAFIDPDLLQRGQVLTAAGTRRDVFDVEPHKLVEASEGSVTDLKRG